MSSASGTGSEGIFDRRYRALTVSIVLAVSVVAFEALGLATIAPVLAQDLGGIGLYGWIFSAFLLAQIVGAVAAGQQADRRGPAKPFLFSLAPFGTGLLASALSTNMMILIFSRALQGLGGGALVTCVYATINTSYPDSLRPRMLAAFSSAFVLPALVGPLIAGFIAEQFTWRAVFYGFLPFLVAVAFLAMPAFGRLVPAEGDETESSPRTSRLPGAILLAVGTGLLLTGLRMISGEDLILSDLEISPTILGQILACIGLLMAIPALHKVLPAGTLVAREGLPATIAAKGLFAAGYFYTEAYLVLALSTLSSYEATTTGLVVSTGAISWTIATWVQERLDRRYEGRGRRARVLIGAVLMASGIVGLAVAVVVERNLPLVVALACWMTSGLGMGLAHPASLTIAFAHAPGGKEGAASSSVLLSELFAPATAIGVGGVLVALGAVSEGGLQLGVALAFGLSPLLVMLFLISTYRLPRDTMPVAGKYGGTL